MGFQVSPGVNISEIDLTNFIPAVSTTDGCFVGLFRWGPCDEVTLVESPKQLETDFGKPNSDTAAHYFTAYNFLNYSAKLRLVRVVDADAALNGCGTTAVQQASVPVVPALIKNRDAYDLVAASDLDDMGLFAAKYPGTLGNSLKVSMCTSSAAYSQSITAVSSSGTTVTKDADGVFSGKVVPGSLITNDATAQQVQVVSVAANDKSFVTDTAFDPVLATGTITVDWEYATEFGVAPGTSDYATAHNALNDECHVIVVDEDGAFTGVLGQVLERFAFCSLAGDAKSSDGTSSYYKNVVNDQSLYVYWTDHETTGKAGNWGDDASGLTFTALTHPVTCSFAGGTDGVSAIADGDYEAGYDLFLNTTDFNVSLIFTGPADSTVTNYVIDNIAEVRKDCVVFCSPEQADVVANSGDEEADTITHSNTITDSSYCHFDTCWKKQYDKYNDVYRWVPGNGDSAGLYARVDQERDPWWSAAGLNRGQIKNVTKLAWSPSAGARENLYPKGINSIITKPGQGTVLWGDKTHTAKPSAFSYLPIRRLFIVLEKAIATAAEYMLFEFNDEFTRNQFKNMVDPYLRDVKGRRGILAYQVVCDETNNTAQVLANHQFVADIYIKPTPTIEGIQLNFIATSYNVEFNEIIGKF